MATVWWIRGGAGEDWAIPIRGESILIVRKINVFLISHGYVRQFWRLLASPKQIFLKRSVPARWGCLRVVYWVKNWRRIIRIKCNLPDDIKNAFSSTTSSTRVIIFQYYIYRAWPLVLIVRGFNHKFRATINITDPVKVAHIIATYRETST
jgi:hypothetical protein